MHHPYGNSDVSFRGNIPAGLLEIGNENLVAHPKGPFGVVHPTRNAFGWFGIRLDKRVKHVDTLTCKGFAAMRPEKGVS
jgi:hypothetical protein